MDLRQGLDRAVTAYERWAAGYGPYKTHPSLDVTDQQLTQALDALSARLTDNYPFFHPRYAGQMLKPPHPAAVTGYLAAMLINPNNHALDGGPATAAMEREVVAQLATMFGFDTHLGHLTSSGTVANLEALYVARETHPGKGIAYSEESHYTHSRMCGLLGVPHWKVPADERGRMDLNALEDLLRGGQVGTVVLTTGTTGLGAIDQVHLAMSLKERYGVRLHVDAAYGGFFTLLAPAPAPASAPASIATATTATAFASSATADGELDPAPWRAIADCDSVVVDPHKHGLQPYGCGAVLFADPSVGRFYVHDSPYTYFTSGELHLGEISLECSRAGAAAAALWLTFQLLPPTPDGLGQVLAAGRRAARHWATLLDASPSLRLYQQPELDIVTYFPRTKPPTFTVIDAASARVMHEGMHDPEDPVFVSVLRATRESLTRRHPDLKPDAPSARILRSVLMKPESETHLDWLQPRLETLATTSTT